MTQLIRSRAYGSVILCMTFWALSFVWIKIVYRIYQPVTAVFIRLVMGSVFLYVLSKAMKQLEPIQKGHWKYFIAISLVQPFLYFLGESYGLKYVSSTVASVIISTIPLFTPFAAVYFLKEKISRLNVFGLGISFFGVMLVIFKADFTLTASPFGLFMLSLSVVAGVTYTTVVKKVTARYTPLTIVTIQNSLGSIWFLPLFLMLDAKQFISTEPESAPVIALFLLAFLPSSLAFVLFAYAIRELGAAKTSMFGNIMPVLTAVFAWMILGDTLTVQNLLGILVVIVGLFISQMRGTIPRKKSG